MNAYAKLVRNGSSTCVNVPRRIMSALGWQSGDDVFIEVTEDRGVIVHRISRAALRRALTIEFDSQPDVTSAK